MVTKDFRQMGFNYTGDNVGFSLLEPRENLRSSDERLGALAFRSVPSGILIAQLAHCIKAATSTSLVLGEGSATIVVACRLGRCSVSSN